MKNTVKFEIEIKKSALKKVRQFLIGDDWEGDSDEDMIQEVFFMFSLRGEVDVRNEVKIKRIKRDGNRFRIKATDP